MQLFSKKPKKISADVFDSDYRKVIPVEFKPRGKTDYIAEIWGSDLAYTSSEMNMFLIVATDQYSDRVKIPVAALTLIVLRMSAIEFDNSGNPIRFNVNHDENLSNHSRRIAMINETRQAAELSAAK